MTYIELKHVTIRTFEKIPSNNTSIPLIIISFSRDLDILANNNHIIWVIYTKYILQILKTVNPDLHNQCLRLQSNRSLQRRQRVSKNLKPQL